MSIYYSEKIRKSHLHGGISSVGPPYPTRCDFRKCWYIQFDIEHWKSHFFGQKLEESVTFGPRTNEVDHFDRDVRDFHQTLRMSLIRKSVSV